MCKIVYTTPMQVCSTHHAHHPQQPQLTLLSFLSLTSLLSPPFFSRLLSPRHNNNVRLSCSHNWDRYFTMTPLFPINNTNNNNTHKNIKSFKVSLGSEFVWGGEPENSHHFDVYIPPTQKQSYMVARKVSLLFIFLSPFFFVLFSYPPFLPPPPRQCFQTELFHGQ